MYVAHDSLASSVNKPQLPQDLDDEALVNANANHNCLNSMPFSIHLFKLARLNSEIKYVANSIVREAPTYAYPSITNIHEWQKGMLHQLDQWHENIPLSRSSTSYIRVVCEIRYHSVRMLLLRPSPAISSPSVQMLIKCHDSALQTIRLFDQLYKKDMLVYSWMTLHSLILSTVTVLYCIRMVPEISRATELDVLMTDLVSSLSIFSATGEHWSGAKRSRDILDDLGRNTIQYVKEFARLESRRRSNVGQPATSTSNIPPDATGSVATPSLNNQMPAPYEGTTDPTYQETIDLTSMDGLWPGQFGEQFGFGSETADVDSIMRNLFDSFIPSAQAPQGPGFYNI